MIEFKYDTQLLIEGENLKKEEISKHINKPWFLLQYCATVGDIFDIVVEDMDRQSRGLKG